jgi:hypothetical protein
VTLLKTKSAHGQYFARDIGLTLAPIGTTPIGWKNKTPRRQQTVEK